MIDLHCHVLPGIDDGPATPQGSIALGRAAQEGGVDKIVATPHVSSRYPNDAATIQRVVQATNKHFRAAGLTVEIVPGAELALTRVIDIPTDELAALSLGGGGWLLIEPPFTAMSGGLETMLLSLLRRGERVLLAHPERCRTFRRDPAMLQRLLGKGMLTSVTAGSFTGSFGRETREFALAMARAGLVHNVASDAHDVLGRPPGIASEMLTAGLEPLAEWLTELVPAALLRGDEPPARGRPSGYADRARRAR